MDVVRASGDVDRVECPADRGPEPCGMGAAVKGEAMSEEKITDEKKTTPVVAEAEKQEKILNALQSVLDPEIGLSVIDLDLIREVEFTPEEAELKMVLTTPFCAYGPRLINHIQSGPVPDAERR